jgi:hypothetical protein
MRRDEKVAVYYFANQSHMLGAYRLARENCSAEIETRQAPTHMHPYWIVCKHDDWNLLQGIWGVYGGSKYDSRAFVLYGPEVEDRSRAC